MRKKRFIINAAITSSSSAIMNLVGISFNVYISNKVGPAGVGLFQLIMSVYGFSVTLASSGINLAATRMVADDLARKEKNATDYIMKKCLAYSAFFGFLSFILLFTMSDYLATNILNDKRTLLSLKALSISMIPIAMSSSMSGYFIAVRRVYKSASAQLFEQFVKITVSIITLELFSKKGIEYACLCMVLSGSISEIASFLYLYLLFYIDKKRYKTNKKYDNAMFSLCKIAIPVAFSAYLRSALITIEHILIPKSLKKSGLDSESSLKCYGIIHGMALPLLLFPSSVLKSFSGLLVPELSECATLGHRRQINHIISRMIKTTMLFSICVSGLYFTFADEIGYIIYKNANVGLYLRLLAPLCVVMYVDGIVDGMLKGLNQQVNSMWYNIIDSAVSVIAVITLLPRYGAGGYVAVIFISELLNAFLSLNRLIKISDFKVQFFSWILIPTVTIYTVGTLVNKFISANINAIYLIIKILFCIVFYLAMLIVFSIINLAPLKTIKRNRPASN